AEAEIGRLRESLAQAQRRAHEATTEFQHLETQVASVEQGEEEVEAFREFLDQVSPDDFLGGGDAPQEPGGPTS
ncbi:MAG: hypothetical protein ACK4M5_11745, partial [Dietzia cercidiphylli]